MKTTVSIAILVLLLTTACGGEGRDEADYVSANEDILSELPVFPGATIKSHTNNPYYLREQGGVSGWTTNVVYEVSSEALDEEVVQFYIEHMTGWDSCREDIGIAEPLEAGQPSGAPVGKILTASFMRDSEAVSLNTDGLHPLTRANTFELGIDHDSHQNRCTGEALRES